MDKLIEILNKVDIQTLASIGTFISALVALLTLRLIRIQIRNSQRPNITLGNSIYGKCKSIADHEFRTIWIRGNDEDKETEYSTLAFDLLNVGIGFAEQIEVEENFDLKKAKEFIKRHDTNSNFSISTSNNELKIQCDFDDEWIRLDLGSSKRELGSLMPLQSKNEKPNSYIFSDEYLAFISCFSHLRERNDRFLSLEKFPRLKFKIRFKDVDGKKYTNKFECSPFCINFNSFSFRFIKK